MRADRARLIYSLSHHRPDTCRIASKNQPSIIIFSQSPREESEFMNENIEPKSFGRDIVIGPANVPLTEALAVEVVKLSVMPVIRRGSWEVMNMLN